MPPEIKGTNLRMFNELVRLQEEKIKKGEDSNSISSWFSDAQKDENEITDEQLQASIQSGDIEFDDIELTEEEIASFQRNRSANEDDDEEASEEGDEEQSIHSEEDLGKLKF